MAKDIPYYFADTGINGEMLGEQNVYSLPLVNSVLTSNPLTITINKTPNSASNYFLSYDNSELGPYTDNNSINRNEILQLSVNDTLFGIGTISSTPLIISTGNTSSLSKIYFLSYDNSELGPNTDNNSINRNEILQLSTTITSTNLSNTSSLSKIYFLSYDNPELGPNTDKTGQYRNEIFEINNQRQYRYLVQDSTGSSYPTGSGNYNSITSSLSTSSSLVLYLNAFVSSSYSGTGSSWYDLSGTYTSASIISGSTFFTGSTTQSINAVVLNGTNQYIQAPSGFADFTNGLTCICFCNFGNVGTWERIMDFGNGSSSDNIGFSRYSTTNSLRFFIYNGSSNVLEVGSNNIIDNNAYAVYTIRLSGSIYDFYKNGVLDSSGTTTVRPPNITRSSNFIGRSNWPDAYWDNGFGIFALWNKGLSNSELSSAHNEILTYANRRLVRFDGSNYCNSNILNLRFVSDSLTGSNLILPSGSYNFTASQDILITNITGTVDNNRINTISSGSNIINRDDGSTSETIYTGDGYLSETRIFTEGTISTRINTISSGSNIINRNDGITNKTIYTGDNYLSEVTIFTRGNVERTTIESSQVIFNSLSDPSKNYSYKGSGSDLIKRNDGITDKTIYTGDGYLSSTTINTIGNIDRIILQGSSVVINTDTNNFIPSINKTFTYEVDYNFMFNQEIDSLLTIVTAYSLPTGFSVSSDAKRIIGYVNFTDTKTIKLELSDGSTYNIVLKPIFFKKKYTY
jgi:hypothetical protein